MSGSPRRFKLFASACFFCGRSSKDGLCAACRLELDRALRPEFLRLLFCEKALTLFDYDAPLVKKLLFCVKRSGLRLAVNIFCEEMARAVSCFEVEFTAIVYVPRRVSQYLSDGVDQARFLAEGLSRRTGIPFADLIRRRGFSSRQHGLSREARRKNVSGKFKVTQPVPRGNILLVDDVITTGATCEEVCRVLAEAGADAVYVLSPVKGGSL